jgi:hypothetical protein
MENFIVGRGVETDAEARALMALPFMLVELEEESHKP